MGVRRVVKWASLRVEKWASLPSAKNAGSPYPPRFGGVVLCSAWSIRSSILTRTHHGEAYGVRRGAGGSRLIEKINHCQRKGFPTDTSFESSQEGPTATKGTPLSARKPTRKPSGKPTRASTERYPNSRSRAEVNSASIHSIALTFSVGASR